MNSRLSKIHTEDFHQNPFKKIVEIRLNEFGSMTARKDHKEAIKYR